MKVTNVAINTYGGEDGVAEGKTILNLSLEVDSIEDAVTVLIGYLGYSLSKVNIDRSASPPKVETKATPKPETKAAPKVVTIQPVATKQETKPEPQSEEQPAGDVLDSEIGKVRVEPNSSGGFKATSLEGKNKDLVASGGDPDEALGNLLDIASIDQPYEEPKTEAPAAEPPKEVRTKTATPRVIGGGGTTTPAAEQPKAQPIETKTAPATQPAAAKGASVSVPAELANAASFRQIMQWMVQNVGQDVGKIVAKCEELKPHVPAIGRLSGDLKERVERALSVLSMNQSGATA